MLDQVGYLTVDQIQQMAQMGHEIASHGLTHQALTKLSFNEVEKELKESKKFLEHALQIPVMNFAPPFGASNPPINYLIQRYYRSSRSIRPGLNKAEAINSYDMRAYVVLKSISCAQVAKWIQSAIDENKSLILIYHRIDDTDEITSIHPAIFEMHLQIIRELGVTPVTIHQLLYRQP